MNRHSIIIVMIIAAAALFMSFNFLVTPTVKKEPEIIQTKDDATDYLMSQGLILVNKLLIDSELDEVMHAQKVEVNSDTKAALIHVWALWCGPCKKELPDFDHAMPFFKENGVEVYCVVSGSDSKHTPSSLKNFYKSKKLKNLPIHIDSKRKLMNYLKIMSYPTTYLVKDGNLVAYFKKPVKWTTKMQNAIKIYLKK